MVPHPWLVRAAVENELVMACDTKMGVPILAPLNKRRDPNLARRSENVSGDDSPNVFPTN